MEIQNIKNAASLIKNLEDLEDKFKKLTNRDNYYRFSTTFYCNSYGRIDIVLEDRELATDIRNRILFHIEEEIARIKRELELL